MRITEISQSNPPAVAAAALILVLFGALALFKLPIQLLPDMRQPQLWIEVGTDMTRVMLDVVSRLNTLPPLPPDADEPRVFAGDNWQGTNAASLLVRPLPGNDTADVAATYQKLMEEVVEPRLARVPGVSRVNLEGGRPQEVQIRFDAFRLAALGLTPQQLAQTVISARDASAGFVNVGRRQFTVRLAGREPVENLGDLIVGWSNDRPLYLREVADIQVAFQDAQAFSYRNGVPGYYITMQRNSDSNTVALIEGVKAAIEELNNGPLARELLFADLSWDASVYVKRAIGFVRESLIIGIFLAVIGVWYFLRGPRALLVLGISIPLSLCFAVITLQMLGRTLNVISLAGLAFSTGIVIDAALIVQGNIIRLVQQGRGAVEATLEGTKEVMPALVASMLTSVAIFLPVLFMQGIEGQLFKDLAITMSVSYAASLLVAMTVIPAANGWALARGMPADQHEGWWAAMTAAAMRATERPAMRWGLVAALVAGASAFTAALVPKVDYLPVAQTDLIWNNFRLPPGGNLATVRDEFAPQVIERLRPHLEGTKHPAVKYYNLSSWAGQWGVAVIYPKDPRHMDEMVKVLREEIMVGFPDTAVFVQRGSLLNIEGENQREVQLYFQGPDLDALMRAAEVAMKAIPEAIPDTYPQPFPALELNQPEIQLIPDEWRISRAGLDRGTVASALRAYTGGLWAGEYFDGNQRLDIILKGNEWNTPEALAELPVMTPGAGVQTVGDLARIELTVGPSQLARINGRRTVQVNFEPPANMSLDEAVERVETLVEPKLRAVLPANAQMTYAGSANQLHAALGSMAQNFILALVILFALMAALFRSIWDSFLVMLVLPISIAGGVAALRIVGLFGFQALDLLTMIGFIILLGLVVNAAILLVDQTRARERAGVPRREAVRQALETRARAIVLSTLTAVLGMLPLILMPGLGAEIYRGLASVVAGGMLFGTLFTWFLMPALLRAGESETVALPAAALHR